MRQTVLFFALLALVSSAPYEEWRGKVIYQVLTDRFSQTVFTTEQCDNLSDYCGGTFQGIINNISYIQGMGFDAVWISPVPENYPEGYHGYWATNWYEINSNFGNSDDLHNLVDTMHNNNMWAMLDVVANHVGPVGFEFSDVNPFSNDSNYHTYCEITDYSNQEQCLFCRLDDLPDLAQEDNTTGTLLLNWVNNMVQTYNFDGLRVDTVPYVPIWFWEQYKASAGVYTVGEVFNGLITFGAQYQGTAMDGILNYPMFFTIRSVFQSGQSMNNIQSYYQGASAWPDQTILGIFVDNHDNPRFLYGNPSVQMFQAALGFSLSVVGIPIIYYGDEQNYNGGPGSACREVLWTNMDPNAPTYTLIAQINAYRTQTQYWNQPQVQRWSDDTFYAFTRGQYFFAFTNGQSTQSRTITYQPYTNGQVLCNLFASSDCVTVSGGSFPVTLNNGEFKFYYPVGSYNPEL